MEHVEGLIQGVRYLTSLILINENVVQIEKSLVHLFYNDMLLLVYAFKRLKNLIPLLSFLVH